MNLINVEVEGHGGYTVTDAALTETMARYLPASQYDLRKLVEERGGETDSHRGVEFATLLIILADMDHNVDHSPLKAY